MKYLRFISLIIFSALLLSCSAGGGGGGDDSSGTSDITIVVGGDGSSASIIIEEKDTFLAGVKDVLSIFSPAEAVAGLGESDCYESNSVIPWDIDQISFSINGENKLSVSIGEDGEEADHCNPLIRTFTVQNGSNLFAAVASVEGIARYSGSTPKVINGNDSVQIIMGEVGLVYVSNADSADVSAIDPVTFGVYTLDCSVFVETNCSEPRNLAVSYDGASVAVPFRHSDYIIDIDTSIPIFDDVIGDESFDEPYAVAFTCDDSEVWVVNKYGYSISIIDASTNSVVETLNDECLSSPEGIAITNNMAYIANRGNGTVCVMNTLTRAFVTTIDVGGDPRFAAATPDGAFVYVSTDSSYAGIKKIRTSDNTVVATIEERGRNLAVTPDGTKVYVGTQSGSIGVINVATNAFTEIDVAAALELESWEISIYGVAISRDGNLGFATDEDGDVVYVFDPSTDTLIMDGDAPRVISVGYTPRAIATQPAPMSCEIIEPPGDDCVPSLTSPAEGEVMDNGADQCENPMEWSFDWSACPYEGATYDIQILNSGEGALPITASDLAASNHEVLYPLGRVADWNLTGWIWQVRATVNGQTGEWSQPGSFTVEPLNTDCYVEPPLPVCGDGNLDPGEECDDGNILDEDGCSANCTIEIISECPAPSIVMHPNVPSQLGGALNVDINGTLWDATFYNQWSMSPQQSYDGNWASDASAALYNLFHTPAFDYYDSNPDRVWGCENSACYMVTPYIGSPTMVYGYSFLNAGTDQARVNTTGIVQDQDRTISFVQWSRSTCQ